MKKLLLITLVCSSISLSGQNLLKDIYSKQDNTSSSPHYLLVSNNI